MYNAVAACLAVLCPGVPVAGVGAVGRVIPVSGWAVFDETPAAHSGGARGPLSVRPGRRFASAATAGNRRG